MLVGNKNYHEWCLESDLANILLKTLDFEDGWVLEDRMLNWESLKGRSRSGSSSESQC